MCCLQYYRGLKNFVAEQPHQHAIYFTSVLVSEMVWTKCELLESLDGQYVQAGIIVTHMIIHDSSW